MAIRLDATTKLELGATLRVLEVSDSGYRHLRGRTGVLVVPYSGATCDKQPIAGLSGDGFGRNLYPGDVVELLA